jgi:hypothetical protein
VLELQLHQPGYRAVVLHDQYARSGLHLLPRGYSTAVGRVDLAALDIALTLS